MNSMDDNNNLSNRSLQSILQILTRKEIITNEEQTILFETNIKLIRLGGGLSIRNDDNKTYDSYPTWKSLHEKIFIPVISR